MYVDQMPVGGFAPEGTIAVNQDHLSEYGSTISEALRNYGAKHGLTYAITFTFPDAKYAFFVPKDIAVESCA